MTTTAVRSCTQEPCKPTMSRTTGSKRANLPATIEALAAILPTATRTTPSATRSERLVDRYSTFELTKQVTYLAIFSSHLHPCAFFAPHTMIHAATLHPSIHIKGNSSPRTKFLYLHKLVYCVPKLSVSPYCPRTKSISSSFATKTRRSLAFFSSARLTLCPAVGLQGLWFEWVYSREDNLSFSSFLKVVAKVAFLMSL